MSTGSTAQTAYFNMLKYNISTKNVSCLCIFLRNVYIYNYYNHFIKYSAVISETPEYTSMVSQSMIPTEYISFAYGCGVESLPCSVYSTKAILANQSSQQVRTSCILATSHVSALCQLVPPLDLERLHRDARLILCVVNWCACSRPQYTASTTMRRFNFGTRSVCPSCKTRLH